MSLIGYHILHKRIDDISEWGMNFVKTNFPMQQRTRDHYRCKRDLKYILWGLARCILHEDANCIKEISHKFVKNKKLVLYDHKVELATYAYIEGELYKLLKHHRTDVEIMIEAMQLLKDNFVKLEEANYTRNFSDLIKERKTTFTWSNKKVSQETVEDILLDLHMYAPSKQNRMPYYLDVLDWKDPDLRHNIFEWCWREPKHDAQTDAGNPQTLAPYLFCFTPRISHNPDDNALEEAMVEIGIASSFIIWNAQSRGLSTGYCACIQEPTYIANALGRKEKVRLLLGLGYKDENATTYFDPRIKDQKDIPADNSYHKSNQENIGDYIIWH